MTSREKVIDVDRQIHAMLAGEQTDFQCPFCNLTTSEGEGILCCDEAAEVINAILDHIEHLERVEIVEKAMERWDTLESGVSVYALPPRVSLN